MAPVIEQTGSLQDHQAGYIRRAIRSWLSLITPADLEQSVTAMRHSGDDIPRENWRPPALACASQRADDVQSPALSAPAHAGCEGPRRVDVAFGSKPAMLRSSKRFLMSPEKPTKRRDRPHQGGRSRHWIKMKNRKQVTQRYFHSSTLIGSCRSISRAWRRDSASMSLACTWSA